MSIRSAVSKMAGAIGKWFGKIMPWIAVVILAIAMLFDPGRDSLGMPSAALAATLGIAAVTFSYARTLKDGSGLREELIFAGERLMSGALAFLFAAIFRHAMLDVPRYMNMLTEMMPRHHEQPETTFFGQHPIAIVCGFAAFVVFVVGLVFTHRGISLLAAVMGQRAKHRWKSDRFFESRVEMDARMTALAEADKEQPQPKQPEKDRS